MMAALYRRSYLSVVEVEPVSSEQRRENGNSPQKLIQNSHGTFEALDDLFTLAGALELADLRNNVEEMELRVEDLMTVRKKTARIGQHRRLTFGDDAMARGHTG